MERTNEQAVNCFKTEENESVCELESHDLESALQIKKSFPLKHK